MVEGCAFNKAKRDSDINLSLSGDDFDVITCIKATSELTCPGIVSCADILTAATRNLINMAGVRFYTVACNLSRIDMSLSQIINLFTRRRLNESTSTGNGDKEPSKSALNNVMTLGKFPNKCITNLQKGLGLLQWDAFRPSHGSEHEDEAQHQLQRDEPPFLRAPAINEG